MANATTKSEFHRPISSGDGRIVVGREVTNLDGGYASMEIDELIFFNNALSTTDIKLLYNAVEPFVNLWLSVSRTYSFHIWKWMDVTKILFHTDPSFFY